MISAVFNAAANTESYTYGHTLSRRDALSIFNDLAFNDEGVTYGDVFKQNEVQFSEYDFEVANTDTLFRWFKDAAEECRACVDAKLPLPAYDQAIKASHLFNTLQEIGRAHV